MGQEGGAVAGEAPLLEADAEALLEGGAELAGAAAAAPCPGGGQDVQGDPDDQGGGDLGLPAAARVVVRGAGHRGHEALER